MSNSESKKNNQIPTDLVQSLRMMEKQLRDINGGFIGHINHRWWWESRNIEHLYDALDSVKFSYDYSIKDKCCIALQYNNIVPTCKECGTCLKFHSGSVVSTFCSKKCRANNEDYKTTLASSRLEKYGVTNPFYDSEWMKTSKLKKFGAYHSDETKATISSSIYDYYSNWVDYERLGDRDWLIEQHHVLKKPLKIIGESLGITYSTIYNYFVYHHDIEIIQTYNSSEEEIVEDLLSGWGAVRHNRSIISPYELDFYIPDKGVAIEVNGLYWHSDVFREKNYHLRKLEMCKSRGIRLLQFWDYEINQKTDIVNDIIQSALGECERVYARKCEVREVNDRGLVKTFLNRNHIQGFCNYRDCVGLFYFGELVSLCTFSKSRFTEHNIELIRFCSRNGLSVIGGFSKILKYYLQGRSCVTYSDNRLFNGGCYETTGFAPTRTNPPQYHYSQHGKLYNRMNFQKKMLKKKLNNYNEENTEYENMQNNGFRRVWDCGTTRWELNN